MIGNPLVSIVVPIFNIDKYLRKCIDSLINQSYESIEIILVNDGSTDNSLSICEEYREKDKRIIVINKENSGLINARKEGVTKANGKFITYVDGDDWVKENMIETFIEHYRGSNADVIIGAHIEKWHDYEELKLNFPKEGIYKGENIEKNVYDIMMYAGKFSQPGIYSYVWGKFYKRDLLVRRQLEVEEDIYIGEDAACLYPCLLDSEVIEIIDDANYYYRQRPGSMIKSPNNEEAKKISVFYEYLKRIFVNEKNKLSLLNQLSYFTLSLLTVRSGFVPQSYNVANTFYPFENIKNDDKIVLYGAGTFGQILFSKLQKMEAPFLVAWIDDIYEEYRRFGLNVDSPQILNEIEFDKIMIAYIDEEVARSAENKLIQSGISPAKISKVLHYETEDISKILTEYGLNANY